MACSERSLRRRLGLERVPGLVTAQVTSSRSAIALRVFSASNTGCADLHIAHFAPSPVARGPEVNAEENLCELAAGDGWTIVGPDSWAPDGRSACR